MCKNKLNVNDAEESKQLTDEKKPKGKRWRYNHLSNLNSKGLLEEYSDDWYEFKLIRYNNMNYPNTKRYVLNKLKENPNFMGPRGLFVKEDLICEYNKLKKSKEQEGISYPNFDFSLVPEEISGFCEMFVLICLDLKKDKSSIIGSWKTNVHRLFSGYLPKEFSQMHMPKRWTKERFIEKSKEVYGENTFDYSNIEFTSISKKVKNIKCNICGSIISPVGTNHIAGHGCLNCSRNKSAEKRSLGKEVFIKRSKKLFGEDTFDYSKVVYVNSNTKVDIFCNRCKNWFSQTPSEHFNSKCGCPKCSRMNSSPNRLTTEEFIERARHIHGNLYDYSKVVYINGETEVLIIDTETKEEFWQKPESHLSGRGNPRRNDSNGEKLIRTWLNSLHINTLSWESEVVVSDTFFKSRNYVKIDFVIHYKEKLYWVEYNGEQHYKISFRSRLFRYYSSKESAINSFKKQIERDKEVKEFCNKNNIVFIEIPYIYKTFDKVSEILNKIIIDGETDLSFIKIPKIEIPNNLGGVEK